MSERVEQLRTLLGTAVVSMGGNEGEHITLECLESQYRKLYEFLTTYDALAARVKWLEEGKRLGFIKQEFHAKDYQAYKLWLAREPKEHT